jgi:inosose dehydratase
MNNTSPAAHSPLSRRVFLQQLSLLAIAAGGSLPAVGLTAANNTDVGNGLVGSNQYGWGQYAERDKKPFDMEGVLSALRDAGYDYLESNLDLNQPENNVRLASQMKTRGLKPVTLYTGARLHEADKAPENIRKLLMAAKVVYDLGFRRLSCNLDPIGREKTDEELKNQVAALKDLGAGLKEIGIQIGIHHHMPEMAGHAREFHYNFQHTDPDQIGFCYDVHWVFKGGVQPMDALRQYGKRIVSWHLRQSRQGIWWEDLDDGDVDYAAIAEYARKNNLPRVFTVELALEGETKITRSAVENHKRSREFVRKVFGV